MIVWLLLLPGSFGFAFLLAWGLNWLGLISWRRSAGQHWAERARRLWPARKSAGLNLWIVAASLTAASVAIAPEANCLFAAGAALLGALLGGYPMSREIYPEIRFKSWLHLVTASLLLVFAFWATLGFGILEMPDHFGPRTWAGAGGILLALVAVLFGLGVRLLRWLQVLKPAPERLQALVRETSQKMGVPVRSTWVLAAHLSNAVALPLTRQLIFTDKLLATHPDDEIKAICAHELGHLSEPRGVILTRTLVALSLFPLVFSRPLCALGENGVRALLALVIVVLLLFLAGFRLGRRMEKRADQIASDYSAAERAIYARALERLYQTGRMPAVMPRRAHKIHPDLYDRMLAAGVTPDFPRPAPPKGICWTTYLALSGLLLFPLAALFVKVFWVILAQTLGHR
jgi:Zn-dependent protease with chaperone function